MLEMANVALNKNTVPGDKSAFIPGGIRVGTPALTSRGFAEEDFVAVAEFIHRGVSIAKEVSHHLGHFQSHIAHRQLRSSLSILVVPWICNRSCANLVACLGLAPLVGYLVD